MKNIVFAFIALLSAQPIFAQERQERIVYECANKHAIDDTLLQRAIQASVANNSHIKFQADDSPCAHRNYIDTAFNRTFKQSLFHRARGYAFALLTNDDNYFSIERFVFKTRQDANAIANIIRQRKITHLQIESLTYFDFFLSGNDLVFFVAESQSFNENKPLFSAIKENFIALRRQAQ